MAPSTPARHNVRDSARLPAPGWLVALCLVLVLLAAGSVALAARSTAEQGRPTPPPTVAARSSMVGLYVQPDDGRGTLLDEIAAARSSINVAVYLLSDEPTIEALSAAAGRGVPVRVLLEEHPFGGDGSHAETFALLQERGIQARWSNPTFRFSHIKTAIVDGAVAFIMNQNLTNSAFSQNRELAIVTTRPADVAQAAAIFDADWARGGEPKAGSLVVSPTDSRSRLLALIDGAERTLDVYAEVVRDPEFIEALERAAARGVRVRLVMSPAEEQLAEVQRLARSGIEVRLVGSPYIHAKLFLVDGIRAFVGSQNLTATSLDQNRELGAIVDDPAVVERIGRVFAADIPRGREVDR